MSRQPSLIGAQATEEMLRVSTARSFGFKG